MSSGRGLAWAARARADVQLDKKSWPAADQQPSRAEWASQQAGVVHKYPAVRRSATQYVKHGVTVPDPYDWLEDPNSGETEEFVGRQNKLYEGYLADVKYKPQLRATIEKLQDYSRTGAPSKRGGQYMVWHNTGLQNQPVLYRMKDLAAGVDGAEVFCDPNALSKDGTTAIAATAWSKSETFWAYATTEKGSDWNKVFVKNVATGELCDDRLEWVKFSGLSWLGDIGFFYTRFPVPKDGDSTHTAELKDCALYFHKLGEPQADDVMILQLPEHDKWLIGGEVSDDHKSLIVTIHDGCEPHNLFWVAALPDDFGAATATEAAQVAQLTWRKVVDEWVGSFDYIGNDGSVFYLQTTHNAPLKKLIRVDLAASANDADVLAAATDLVPERASKLDFCGLVKDTLLLVYLEDVKHVVYHKSLALAAADAADAANAAPAVADDKKADDAGLNLLPGVPIGTMSALSCRRECDHVAFKMTSFLLPGRSYTTTVDNLADGLKVWKDDTVAGFNPDDFEAEQVFFDTTDGARVPMFICHRKGLKLDGTNPTLLYAYGGFNISVTPSFSASRIAFLRHFGGILAVANIRGGGEYGEAWHNAGAKFNKQNCYVDFVKAGEFLIAKQYTTPAKLAIMGGSNGGLLVAATANKAPHLFGAVVCQVGVLDMFKFHKFTIGHAWTSDFGDPEEEADFKYLTEYSPIHNVKTGVQYPKVMVATADHDDRVVPAHSHKYIATLQHANPEHSVFVARIDVSAGHGHGKPTSKVIDEAADTYAFLTKALGASWQA